MNIGKLKGKAIYVSSNNDEITFIVYKEKESKWEYVMPTLMCTKMHGITVLEGKLQDIGVYTNKVLQGRKDLVFTVYIDPKTDKEIVRIEIPNKDKFDALSDLLQEEGLATSCLY